MLKSSTPWAERETAMRLALVTSHPVQYYAPLFRALAQRCDLHVFYALQVTPAQQASAGFDVAFQWDVDLLSGYEYSFLDNRARDPSPDRFSGCDTPEIGDRLRAGKFDAVLTTGWYLKSFWQTIIAAKRNRIPVMVRGDSHLQTPRSHLKRLVKRLVYPTALGMFDAALYVGERSRRYWEFYGFPAHRLIFSPHCVDNDWFAERATPDSRAALRAANDIAADENVVLFAGKLLALKRPTDLILATRKLLDAGQRLSVMIAGSGPLREEVAAAARASNVRLIELGFCNQTQMPASYAAAEVLALPSESETWGLVANEALAAGIPILVSDACGCAPDLAADQTAGGSFPVGNIDALAAALKRIIDHRPSPAAIAAKVARYSVPAAVDGVLAAGDVVRRRRLAS